eukprot:2795041-Alexandrium_andersonii.AAC.1
MPPTRPVRTRVGAVAVDLQLLGRNLTGLVVSGSCEGTLEETKVSPTAVLGAKQLGEPAEKKLTLRKRK